jgi:uncharacterized protein YjbI with pentapeptide repeats
MTVRIAVGLLMICGMLAGTAAAQPVPPDMSPVEAAAWSAITAGKTVNFDATCGKIDPANAEHSDPCHTIGHGFLETILTQAPWSGQIPREGMHLQGALIRGMIDLSNATIKSELALTDSVLKGGLNLDRATLAPLVDLGGSTIGFLSGERVSIADNLWLRKATVTGPVNLRNARLGNQADFAGSRFANAVTLAGASLGGNLILSGAQFDSPVRLDGSHIAGTLSLVGARLAGALVLVRSQIDGDADFSGSTFEGAVTLARASIHGDLVLSAITDGEKKVPASQVRRQLRLYRTTVSGSVDLREARFDCGIEAPYLHVVGALEAAGATFGDAVNLNGASIDGVLGFLGTRLTSVDLGRATIGQLLLGAPGSAKPDWAGSDGKIALSLRNAHAGTLQDTTAAWPREVNLGGFTYDRLAGLGGRANQSEVQPRPDEWWQQWLARDPSYSPQPYQQLASVLALEGNNDAADAVRLAERERARAEAWKHRQWADWALLTALEFTVGYGIGGAAFRVIYWVVGLALLGALVLWTAPAARRKGSLWCVGASLSRLLPIIELNSEFTDFFKDPNRERLRAWQLVFFAVLGVLGALLGSVLVAAISGLTQPH